MIVKFIIHPDGTVTDPELLKSSKNDAVNAEALRLVSKLPKFHVKYYTPKKVPIAYNLPVIFQE